MKVILQICVFLLFSLQAKAQLLFYQDTYKGGVTADGVSYADHSELQPDTIHFQLHIPTTAIIKRAFLFTERYVWLVGSSPLRDAPLPVKFNSTNLSIDSSDVISSTYYCVFGGANWISYKDVTGFVQNSGNVFITPDQVALMSASPSRDYVYSGYYLIVLYEDNNLPIVNTVITLNNQGILNNISYAVNGINPINNINDVGLSIWADQSCSLNDPGTQLNYNLQSTAGTYTLGTLDENNGATCLQTLPGSFYYENNTLHGLVDDTPDSLINKTDALANIKHYVLNNSNAFTLSAASVVVPGCSSYRNAFILAYSTPCPARSKDTTLIYNVCARGNSVQLAINNNTANSTYSWYSNNGDVNSLITPTVAVTPTVSTNYIAYVDSAGCKHTEHFKVNVHNLPQINSINTTTIVCGNNGILGTATITANNGTKPYTYNIGAANQSMPTFTNLAVGTYTAIITDSATCTAQQTFTITEINTAVASFSINPTVACVNDPVDFYNTSTTTNGQWWNFGTNLTDTSIIQNPTYIYNDTGIYNATLIVWRNQRQCSDTLSKTVLIKDCPPDSFSVTVPNVFSPNADGINDAWQLIVHNYNYTVSNCQCTIYDRWGVKVFETSSILQGWDGRSTSGLAVTAGTYFYIIKLTATNSNGKPENKDFKGYLELVR